MALKHSLFPDGPFHGRLLILPSILPTVATIGSGPRRISARRWHALCNS